MYAKFERKAVSLASSFGAEMAARWFTAEQLATVPTYVRGPKKGQTKGWLVWDKVVSGGWVKDGPGYLNGHVVRPGMTNVRIEVGFEPFLASYGPVAASSPALANGEHMDEGDE